MLELCDFSEHVIELTRKCDSLTCYNISTIAQRTSFVCTRQSRTVI